MDQKKAYTLMLSMQKGIESVLYHQMRLGRPMLEKHANMRSGLPNQVLSLGEENEHSFGFDSVEEAVKEAEKVIRLDRSPHRSMFNPEMDKDEAQVREMHLVGGRIYIGECVMVLNYIWGKYDPLYGPKSKDNLKRRAAVEGKWKLDQQASKAMYN